MMPADKEFYRRIDEVAHYIWDPIGVSGSPHARDEYHAYLPGLFGRVKSGKLDDIVEYMKWIASERMGLSFDEMQARMTAESMLEWKRRVQRS